MTIEVRTIANKTVVQKNGVETLHGNRNALKKILSRSSPLDELMRRSRALRNSAVELLKYRYFQPQSVGKVTIATIIF
jgi:hypothetical protein